MTQPNDADRIQELLTEAFDNGTFRRVAQMLNGLNSADAAHLIESSPPKERQVIWSLIDQANAGEVLQFLSDDVQAQFLSKMDFESVVALTEGLNVDDVADILQQLPDRVIQEVLQAMDSQDRHRVEKVLTHAEDTAGGLMDTDTITVRPNNTLDVVLRYLRRHDELPDMTDNLIVVNRNDEYLGVLPLRKLLVSDPSLTVREVMITSIEAIPSDMPDEQVAILFQRHDLVSAPVIDSNNLLVGRITIDDVVDVIREDAEHSWLGMAGLDEDEDTFATVRKTAPKRIIWLGINLITAFIAAGTINLFEDTIEKVVALAILMPIVASMGGVAGSQTLTVVIRGIALGQLSSSNTLWLINREIINAAINGMIWALVVAIAASAWFSDPKIGLIIAAAMVINLLTAAIAGALLPLFLKSVKIDPALAGSVILTTVTDVVGFVSFLGLATVFYA